MEKVQNRLKNSCQDSKQYYKNCLLGNGRMNRVGINISTVCIVQDFILNIGFLGNFS